MAGADSPKKKGRFPLRLILAVLEFIGRPFFYAFAFIIILLSLIGTALIDLFLLVFIILKFIAYLPGVALSLLHNFTLKIRRIHFIKIPTPSPKKIAPKTTFQLKSFLTEISRLWRNSFLRGVSVVAKPAWLFLSVFKDAQKRFKKREGPKPTKAVKVYPPEKHFQLPQLHLRVFRPTTLFVLLFSLSIFVAGFATWRYIFKDLPSPRTLTTRRQALTTRIFDRKGQLLFKFYKNENRTLAPLPEIPLSLRQATIAIEDKDFYSHPGISFRGILRAVWRNFSTGTLSGGSTITQQLVKNALLTPQKSWSRKIKEAILAVGVELDFTKDQILEMYLNEVPYGGSTYGVAEASETYFGKRVQDLTLAQAAFLAGLPASPTEFSPFGEHPELAKDRQKEVLSRMVADGYITQPEADKAVAEKLVLREPNINILAPHFVMYIRSLLAQKYGEVMVDQGGLQVFTSLDLDLQEQAQKIVSQEIDKVRFLHITQGAALVTNPKTGEILAMIGSKNYFDMTQNGNVNATISLRQPGSSIKPVNYAVALENGFTPATIIPDSPITYQTPGQPPYSPVNYDHKFHGNVPLRIALASSYNVPAVKVLAAVGVARMIEQGQKMGITTWDQPDRYGLSLTLGGGDVRMVDMAVVYGTLANLGLKVDLHPILRVDDSQGHVLEKYTCTEARPPTTTSDQGFLTKFPGPQDSTSDGCQNQPVLNPKVAYILSDILADNVARSPAFGAHSDLVIPGHQVSVKTGTTNNLKDNWTIGYTKDLLTAVWVGNFDSSPMSYVASGVTGASPIWNKIMTTFLANKPDEPLTPPKDLEKVEVCLETGTLSCSACPNKKTEYFLPGTAPRTACSEEQIKKIQEEKEKLKKEAEKPNP